MAPLPERDFQSGEDDVAQTDPGGGATDSGITHEAGAAWIAQLWSEYQNRHDLIWKRIFRTVLVVAFLSIVPYVQPDLIPTFSWAILLAPALGLPFAIGAYKVISNEYALFSTVRKAYRKAVGPYVEGYPKPEDKETVLYWRLFMMLVMVLWALNFLALIVFVEAKSQGPGWQ